MGLGLTIVNSILADHKATIRVRDHESGGTMFVIEFPV
jgi:K+-sensing histidine kinase KdpD